jgi:hypothetical protein
MVDELLVDLDSISSYEEVAFLLTSLSESAFAASDGSVDIMKTVYDKMLKVLSTLYAKQGDIPNSSSLFTSILNSMTQNPQAMDEASRNNTHWALDSLLTVKSDYMGEEESQKNMEIIANLMTSNVIDSDASYSTQSEFQVSMLNYAELFGAKVLRGTIRDQQSNVYSTDEFVIQPSRNSPEGLSEVEFLVPAGNSTAGAKVPRDFAIGTNVTALDALDSFLVVTNFKGYKLLNNETVPAEADTYVGPVSVISFSTKLSGVQDVTGKVKELPESVLLNFTNMPSNATLTIPVSGIGSEAKPNCTWLNETGDYWTTKGCYLVSFTDSNEFCNCSHFTMFSVQSSGEGLVDASLKLTSRQMQLGCTPAPLS